MTFTKLSDIAINGFFTQENAFKNNVLKIVQKSLIVEDGVIQAFNIFNDTYNCQDTAFKFEIVAPDYYTY